MLWQQRVIRKHKVCCLTLQQFQKEVSQRDLSLSTRSKTSNLDSDTDSEPLCEEKFYFLICTVLLLTLVLVYILSKLET
jgi:hypothetical protein